MSFYTWVSAKEKPSNLIGAILWNVFGNADDGVEGLSGLVEVTPGQFNWAWWRRNPFHNLCFYTWASEPQAEKWSLWPADGDKTKFNKNPFLFSFRVFGMEGYIGLRPRGLPDGTFKGVFGVAFRRQ